MGVQEGLDPSDYILVYLTMQNFGFYTGMWPKMSLLLKNWFKCVEKYALMS